MRRYNKDRGGMSFFGDCALVMIDEVHLLAGPSTLLPVTVCA